MYVVATAGHVDHGKSTLVRALTGVEPDRWAEEKRRGLTIDLGFAAMTTPSEKQVAFVDVPGHERFLGNMLAGLGPAPIVCFVVAADEGWQAQSAEHRDAIRALGIERGVVAITRTDLAPNGAAEVVDQARRELAETGLRDAPVIAVSAVTGDGIQELVDALEGVLATAPDPLVDSRIRVWIDRAFSIKGSGTVVTGTLSAGTICTGDRLTLHGAGDPAEVSVRGLQQHDAPVTRVTPVSRVAVNLRGIEAGAVHRGDVLTTGGQWQLTDSIDVRRCSGPPLTDLPEQLMMHVGTLAIPARIRPFGAETARVTCDRDLPLTLGDRIILRDSGSRSFAGVQVVDVDPPALRRRGAGRRRAQEISARPTTGDVRAEVARRQAVTVERLQQLGVQVPEAPPTGVVAHGDWWVDEAALTEWAGTLRTAVETDRTRNPLSAGLSRGAAADLLQLPDPSLLALVVTRAELSGSGSAITTSAGTDDLGPAEEPVAHVESRLRELPFAAPEADELTRLGLGARELAAAERVGRLLRLPGEVILLPTAPALAMRELSRLPEVFTTSEARKALDTTRRVAIPLLEHLDARGWTRRIDAGHRSIVR
ncbi:selenocysteine-specific translation elongation factor [Flexivirga sp. B27]